MNTKHNIIKRLLKDHQSSDLFINSLEIHRLHPDILLPEYLNRNRIKFGIEVCSHKLVYLDTKYWLLLRDSYLANNNSTIINNILTLLKSLVESNKIICPISPAIFFEILKQSDPNTKIATAEVIDVLSKGYTIVDHYRILKNELIFFGKKLKGENITFDAHKLTLWRRVGTILGDDNFQILNTPLEIQKSFYDILFKINFREMIEILNTESEIPFFDKISLANKLTKEKFDHADEIESFELLLTHEFCSSVIGILDIFKDDLEIISELSNIQIKVDPSRNKNIFYDLPSFYSFASIHAAIRYDKNRKYKPNDFFDFIHASSAIPYYNIFFTENSLKHLITTKPLKLHDEFNLNVISEPAEVLEYLSEIV